MPTEFHGTLQVRVSAAGAAFPIPGANVTITTSGEDAGEILYSLITDGNGVTGTVSLPAPDPRYSLDENSPVQPYSNYDVFVSKDGYYDKIVRNLPIFAGIPATLPVNMIPIAMYSDQFPQFNLETVITENEELR